MGGVLFIDEAYYLYRPENERDYGQEAIEILLQVMENQRDDLVVILAGYKDRMDRFFQSNPGMASRIAHHIDFPGLHRRTSSTRSPQLMLERMQYRLVADGASARSREYIARRRAQPNFANARSIRNALDRARLRQANRLFARRGATLTRDELMTIEAEDIRASRVFGDATGGSRERRDDRRGGRRCTTPQTDADQVHHRGAAQAPRRHAASFTALVNDIRLACKRIANVVGKGALAGARRHGRHDQRPGRGPEKLDVIANESSSAPTSGAARSPAMVSEEMDDALPRSRRSTRAAGTCSPSIRSTARRNIDVNVSVGIDLLGAARARTGATDVGADAFLQPGTRQVCAGLRDLRADDDARAHARARRARLHARPRDRRVHPHASRTCGSPTRRASSRSTRRTRGSGSRRSSATSTSAWPASSGPRGKDFNMRWIASLVAEAHRILMRGGVFLYPRDDRRTAREPGSCACSTRRTRSAMLIEQAGGRRQHGPRARSSRSQPDELHQRTGFVFGSRAEVERIERYHRDHNERRHDAAAVRRARPVPRTPR